MQSVAQIHTYQNWQSQLLKCNTIRISDKKKQKNMQMSCLEWPLKKKKVHINRDYRYTFNIHMEIY